MEKNKNNDVYRTAVKKSTKTYLVQFRPSIFLIPKTLVDIANIKDSDPILLKTNICPHYNDVRHNCVSFHFPLYPNEWFSFV